MCPFPAPQAWPPAFRRISLQKPRPTGNTARGEASGDRALPRLETLECPEPAILLPGPHNPSFSIGGAGVRAGDRVPFLSSPFRRGESSDEHRPQGPHAANSQAFRGLFFFPAGDHPKDVPRPHRARDLPRPPPFDSRRGQQTEGALGGQRTRLYRKTPFALETISATDSIPSPHLNNKGPGGARGNSWTP